MKSERIDQLLDVWMSDRDRGVMRTATELCAESPELESELSRRIEVIGRFEKLANGENQETLVSQREIDTSHSSNESIPASLRKPTPMPASIGGFIPVEILGEGGMGAVYLAEDRQLGRRVAVKVMKKELAADLDARRRFLREARAMAKIEHDNIMTIYAVGEDQGIPFLVMPVLKGETLDDRLRRHAKLPVTDCCRISREIADGLNAAHAHGLIHRDIKPSNIWLEGKQGRVRILDFGLARPATEDQRVTQSGAVLGTPAYMAPEQAAGTDATPRSDLFSLGAVMYRMATGEQPFAGPNMMATLNNLANKHPEAPRTKHQEIPEDLSVLIQRLIAKDPEQRPESAAVVLESLQQVSETLTSQATAVVPKNSENSAVNVSAANTLVKPSLGGRSPGIPRKIITGGLAGLLLLLAVVVYRIQTDHGTLIVTIDDDQVEAKLNKDGLVIEDAKTGRTWKLTPDKAESMASGEYRLPELEGLLLLVSDDSGTEFKTQEFKIKRGDRITVLVTLATDSTGFKKLSNADTKPKNPDYAREREIAEWVLLIGGTVGVQCTSGKVTILTHGPIPEERCVTRIIKVTKNSQLTNDELSRLTELSNLQELALTESQQINDTTAGMISRIPTLRSLDLSSTALTDRGLSDIAKLSQLTGLNIHGTGVTDVGVAELAKVTTLRALKASSCRISIVGLRSLSNLPLTTLAAGSGYTKIQMSDISEIAALFPKLHWFDGRFSGTSATGLSPLASLPDLSELMLSSKDVVAGEPHQLASFPRLKRLHVYHEKMPAAFFVELEKITKVNHLTLQMCDLDDDALAQFAKSTTIRQLSLFDWSGGDTNLLKLIPMTQLRSLNLRNSTVTAEGAKTFHDLRPDVAISDDFNLPAVTSSNYEKERDVANWALSIGAVVEISIIDNPGTVAAHLPLPDHLFVVRRISFRDNPQFQDTDFQRLNGLSSLEYLSITDNGQLSDSGFGSLRDLIALKYLSVSGTTFGDQGMKAISECPQLESLNIMETPVSDSGLSHLSQTPRLRTLLTQGKQITMVGLRVLANAELQQLTISQTGVRYEDLSELSSLFSHLQTLDFRHPAGNRDFEHSDVAGFESLKRLALDSRDISAASPFAFSQLPELRELAVSYETMPIAATCFSELRSIPQIQKLQLGPKIKLGEGAIEQLAAVPTLQHISAMDFELGDEGLLTLAAMPELKSLYLRHVRVTKTGVERFKALRADVSITGSFDDDKPLPSVPDSAVSKKRVESSFDDLGTSQIPADLRDEAMPKETIAVFNSYEQKTWQSPFYASHGNLTYCSDGKWICACDFSNVYLFDAATLKLRKRYSGVVASNSHRPVAFDPQSRTLLIGNQSAYSGTSTLVTDLTSPELKTRRLSDVRPVIVVAFSPDGLQLAMSENGGLDELTVAKRDPVTNAVSEPEVVPDLPDSPPNSAAGQARELAFSPDGKWLIEGRHPFNYRVFHQQDEKFIPVAVISCSTPIHNTRVVYSFTKDHKRALLLGIDACHLLDLSLLDDLPPDLPVPSVAVQELETPKELNSVADITISADGLTWAASKYNPGAASQLLIGNWVDGRPVVTQTIDMAGTGPGQVALSSDAGSLAVIADNVFLRVFDLTQDPPVERTSTPMSGTAVASSGNTALSVASDGTLQLQSLEGGQIRILDTLKTDQPLMVADLSTDGKRAITRTRPDFHSSFGSRVQTWNIEEGKLKEFCAFEGTEARMWALCKLAAKGDRVLYGNQMWDISTATPKVLAEFSAIPPSPINALSSDGQTVAFASRDGQLSVYEVSRPDLPLATLQLALDPGMEPRSLAFNSDGSRLVVSVAGGQCAVLDFKDGQLTEATRMPVTPWAMPPYYVPYHMSSAVFSKDGHRVYFAGWNCLGEWNLDENKVTRSWALPGQSSLSLADDGRHLVMNNSNCTTWILRLPTP